MGTAAFWTMIEHCLKRLGSRSTATTGQAVPAGSRGSPPSLITASIRCSRSSWWTLTMTTNHPRWRPPWPHWSAGWWRRGSSSSVCDEAVCDGPTPWPGSFWRSVARSPTSASSGYCYVPRPVSEVSPRPGRADRLRTLQAAANAGAAEDRRNPPGADRRPPAALGAAHPARQGGTRQACSGAARDRRDVGFGVTVRGWRGRDTRSAGSGRTGTGPKPAPATICRASRTTPWPLRLIPCCARFSLGDSANHSR